MTDSLFSSLVPNLPMCAISLNGVSFEVPAQCSVAAALLYLGQRTSSQHPVNGEPRAPLCHMGVCFECVITIDAVPAQRACMRQVTAGMQLYSRSFGQAHD